MDFLQGILAIAIQDGSPETGSPTASTLVLPGQKNQFSVASMSFNGRRLRGKYHSEPSLEISPHRESRDWINREPENNEARVDSYDSPPPLGSRRRLDLPRKSLAKGAIRNCSWSSAMKSLFFVRICTLPFIKPEIAGPESFLRLSCVSSATRASSVN